MKVVIFGLGYVGFTAACCIASEGHSVVGIDVSPKKVEAIRAGRAPIVEPGVEEMLKDGLARGLIDAEVLGWMRPDAMVLCVSITMSTMLLKQHSCIDVVLGALLALVLDALFNRAAERSEQAKNLKTGDSYLAPHCGH